ncbi:aminotransferase class I/II-fold pyridoxal phosphate-dependent enzyme [Gammaproteobacteria bacterium]|nr:aminotransferase class I/II-fold pyridoxal phosphate-dependent enzyme [Gammaproteobacteria bacterium]MDA7851688.1 aminotransferase class I/II-fold pyridoxal phosphate-dependent enzyme [Gammaproteobacteria bacterium]MDA8925231.1 aminotransferase class I/II-fold pyridoxal phosphate-dependent enzyme [Gammaproteobacteria bacterium]MDB4277791.1 aminotransferase class I/II-fold pyridoxal phosphate-dependent enzyme [Gammaproteobacteria bacterium]MDB9700233.1 aminotransferase class I/II-fold pyridox
MEKSLESKFTALKAQGLSIDLTRGKPGSEQLDLSNSLLSMEVSSQSFNGTDVRNYGEPLGILEARELGASLLSAPIDSTLVGEQSSLLLIYQLILANYLFGLKNPWKDQENLKFICPVPGFDRHFRLLEDFGIEMLTVPLTGSGIDMKAVHALLQEHENIKGIICVPRHSNPTGDTYTDENISALLEAGKAYSEEFLFIFDHAYLLHDFLPSLCQTPTWELIKQSEVEDQAAVFCSFSKVTFGGGGLAFAAAGKPVFDLLIRQRASMIVCSDKPNQLRHVQFLKDHAGVIKHMSKHAEIVRPKFELAFAALDALSPDIGDYQRPTGGYFISYNAKRPIATRVIELCKEVGVLITPAGSTFPHFLDPLDSNIRLAPTFLGIDELKIAMDVFVTALEIAHQETA